MSAYRRSVCFVTLHQSYLEWLEYKTAKPLLYTVYTTKPKTVRKEMIGKRDKF